jgi:hypothetical protein
MVVYNAGSKELTAKIVYYGPGMGGKTTNLQFLHRRLEPDSVGNLLTLAATADRTIFFDLLPVELGELKGYRIRFQVATVPGQTPYNETRRVVLRGVDGVVFVVDSRWSMLPKNLESFQNLKDNLKEEGIPFESIPIVIQFNKRDLPDVLAIDALQEALGIGSYPFVEAVASDGRGVVESFKLISKLTFVEILRRLQKKGTRFPRTESPGPMNTGKIAAFKPAAAPVLEAVPESIPQAPEPMPFSLAAEADASATQAIPILRNEPRSNTAPAAAVHPEDTNPGIRADSIVFETFSPFPEPKPINEDTNPAFFPPAAEPPAAERTRASTTAALEIATPPQEELALDEDFRVRPSQREITTPLTLADRPKPSEFTAGDSLAAELPPPASTPSALPALEARIAKLEEFAAEARGRDDGALSTKVGEIEERLRKLAENRTGSALSAVETRLTLLEASRGWERDINALRTEWGESRLASSRQLEDLSSRLERIVRESESAASSLEALQQRLKDMEERFTQLTLDQESRLARAERLLEEQSARVVQEQNTHRTAISELQEALQRSREESHRRLAGVEEIRDSLASALSDLAEKLRRAADIRPPE